MKRIRHILLSVIALAAVPLAQSCDGEKWLDAIVKSKIVVENSLNDYESFDALVVQCEQTFRNFYFGFRPPLTFNMNFSDVSFNTMGYYFDWDKTMKPTQGDTSSSGSYAKERVSIWTAIHKGLRYAGCIINRIDRVDGVITEEQKNELLGQGHFYRAFYYYMLVHEFGDVPWTDSEVSAYKADFMTYDRWSILESIEKEAQFAWEHLAEVANYGRASKWAAGVLYMKILMCNQKWDEAIKVGEQIIAAKPLVTERIISKYANLQLDLHSVEAKTSPKNTENIFCVVNADIAVDQAVFAYTMGMVVPSWTGVRTPEGKLGTQAQTLTAYRLTEYDNGYMVGSGQGFTALSNYSKWTVWTSMEANDERGRFNHDSWRYMEDLYYNMRGAGTYFNQHLIKPVFVNETDSLGWYHWPHYKCFVEDEVRTDGTGSTGGKSCRFVFRTAEVYQMIAECYYWKGDLAKEAEYLNVVRKRAKAEPYTSVTGIEEILAERNRELFYEEYRHDELIRIAMTYAKTGKKCEATGYTYCLEKFSGNGGENEMLKEKGYNFYYDWMIQTSELKANVTDLGNGVKSTMSVHHALWPIPEQFIVENILGTINQTPGYISIKNRITPLKI